MAARGGVGVVQERRPNFDRFARNDKTWPSLGDSSVERPFDLMEFAQFDDRERRNAVLRHENAQFVACVDRERIRACVNQPLPRVIVGAKEDRLLQRLRVHHHEGPLQHDKQPGLTLPERFHEVGGTRFDWLHGQLVARPETKIEPQFCCPAENFDWRLPARKFLAHSSMIPPTASGHARRVPNFSQASPGAILSISAWLYPIFSKSDSTCFVIIKGTETEPAGGFFSGACSDSREASFFRGQSDPHLRNLAFPLVQWGVV